MQASQFRNEPAVSICQNFGCGRPASIRAVPKFVSAKFITAQARQFLAKLRLGLQCFRHSPALGVTLVSHEHKLSLCAGSVQFAFIP